MVSELSDINEQSKVFDDNSSEDNEGDFETAASQDEDKTILNESLSLSYSMGNSLLTFDKNNVIVNEVTFPRTKSLMELLIMKNLNSEYVKKPI